MMMMARFQTAYFADIPNSYSRAPWQGRRLRSDILPLPRMQESEAVLQTHHKSYAFGTTHTYPHIDVHCLVFLPFKSANANARFMSVRFRHTKVSHVIKLLLAKLLEFEVRATSPNDQNCWKNHGVMAEDAMRAIEKVGFNDTKQTKKDSIFTNCCHTLLILEGGTCEP
jgi:hypothetical protein